MENKIDFTIIYDTREQTPWDFSYEKSASQEIGTLKTEIIQLKDWKINYALKEKDALKNSAIILVANSLALKKN